jgi:glutaredoxin
MDITVFGTPICPNCKNVTSFLDSAGVRYQYKTIGEDVEKADVDALVGRAVRSVPVIVSNGLEVTFDDLRRQVSATEMSSALAALEL